VRLFRFRTLGRTVYPLVLAGSLCAVITAHAADLTVTMTNNETFAPPVVTIHAGDEVTWKNTSSAVHTVTDDPKLAANPNTVHLMI
jgi:plastocyanin